MDTIVIIYAAEDQQYMLKVDFLQGMTVQQAIDQSGIKQYLPTDLALKVGIFSQRINSPEQHVLKRDDRIEIYRPLKLNPMQIRRLRAERHPVGRLAKKGNQAKVKRNKTDRSDR